MELRAARRPAIMARMSRPSSPTAPERLSAPPLSRGPVLVTGASGFLGAHLVAALLGRGIEPHLLGRRPADAAIVGPRGAGLPLHRADLADAEAVAAAVRAVRPEVVFHLGAYTSVDRAWSHQGAVLRDNVLGTSHLLDACLEVGVGRFVNVGTCEEYGDRPVPFAEDDAPEPVSPYSAGKAYTTLLCRMLARTQGFPAVCLRPFLSYGPGQAPTRFVPQAIAAALARRPFPMTTGEQTREWNYAPDLAQGILAAGERPGLEGEVVNVACGEEVPVIDLARRIFQIAGAPLDLIRAGALPHRPGETPRFFADTRKCREMLGYSPSVGIGEGLLRTVTWYRDRGVGS